MASETTTPRHTYAFPVGARVKVAVDDERGSRWYAGTVVAHSTIGQAYYPGGYPTYDIATDDGRRYDRCSPACVKAARKAVRS